MFKVSAEPFQTQQHVRKKLAALDILTVVMSVSLLKSLPVGSQPPTFINPEPWLYWLVPFHFPSVHVLPYKSVNDFGNLRIVRVLPSPRMMMVFRWLITAVKIYVPEQQMPI